MNKIQETVIKLTLYIFYLYVLVLYGFEQFYFLNHGLFISVLAFLGLLITFLSSVKYSLFYRLIIFPVIGTNIFQHYIKPIFGVNIFSNYGFWLFYLFLIILITYQNKILILFLVSIWGFFVTFTGVPSKYISSFSYWEKFTKEKKISPVVKLVKSLNKDDRGVYIICLDGYPDIVLKNNQSILPQFLLDKGFKKVKNISIGDTPLSVPFLLTNFRPNSMMYAVPFTNYNFKLKSLMQKVYNENSIEVYAIFNDYWITNYYFNLFPKPPVNLILDKIFKSLFPNPESILNVDYAEKYHQNLIRNMKVNPKIGFYHFLTFHGLGYLSNRDLIKDLIWADSWLKKSIETIEKVNPKAHIVVFSDHGERNVKGYDRNKSILYYK